MSELSELIAARRRKLERHTSGGTTAYPHSCRYSHRLAEIASRFAEAGSEESPEEVSICARIVAWRDHGKSVFAHLEDATGRLQAYFRRDVLGDEAFAALGNLDIGDFVQVRGGIFRTKTRELTLKVKACSMLAKAMRPPPEKWHGLRDVDARYRQRHVDLQANPQVREIFRSRAALMREIRAYLDGRGYLEVETPVLQPLYGGADATPFTTYYESLDTTYYLRISNELYLKRLLAGGMDRVYEFSRDFRNEGIDRTHMPEFTLLELYEAYADYETMMRITEDMIKRAVAAIRGSMELEYQGAKLALDRPWSRISFVPALAEKLRFDPLSAGMAALRHAADLAKIASPEHYSRPKLIDKLFGALVQRDLIQPTYVTDHPLELSPLAKAHRDNPNLAERFELIVAGNEIANAFSELNDPDEQRRRFEGQAELRRQGDDTAQALDEDFIRVLEQGMPPAGGLGIGIDRLMMLLCDASSIREVILFPQLRSESSPE